MITICAWCKKPMDEYATTEEMKTQHNTEDTMHEFGKLEEACNSLLDWLLDHPSETIAGRPQGHALDLLRSLRSLVEDEGDVESINQEVATLLHMGRRITAIKLCQTRLGLGLREAKAHVDEVEIR